MSFRPYFIEGGTALERGLQTAAEALGTGIVERANQTTFQRALNQLNLPPNTSEALSRLANTPGGRTEAVKIAGELIQRGGGLGLQFGQPAPPAQVTGKVSIDEKGNVVTEDVIAKIQRDPAVIENLFQGLKSNERVKRQESFRKVNNPIISENIKLQRSFKDTDSSLKRMQTLDDSSTLPQGIGILNLNTDGTLKNPRFASAEAQEYSKEVVSQLENAKAIFGGRLTNFDVETFFKSLPTLGNSREGRRLINQTMQVKNEIKKLRADALTAVYDAYGSQNIDSSTAERLATEAIKDEEDALFQKLENVYPEIQKAEKIQDLKNNVKKGFEIVQKTNAEGQKTIHTSPIKDFEENVAGAVAEGGTLERL